MATNSTGSLQGIKVIDVSRILGGPYCGQILGDHGADVLKIEPPQGDDTRAWGPPYLKDREGQDTRESSGSLPAQAKQTRSLQTRLNSGRRTQLATLEMTTMTR